MVYQPIIGTLGYVINEDQVLLIHRNARPEDEHLGKWNGLGGKLEANESVSQCMRREIYEESGLHAEEMSLRGTVNWSGFGRNGEDWLGFIFIIHTWNGVLHTVNAEGTLSWQPLKRLLSGELPLWEGDQYFLPLVFDQDPRIFHGSMPYHLGRPVSWQWERF